MNVSEDRSIISDLAAAASTSPHRGFRLVNDRLEPSDISYDELYSTSCQVAVGWLEAGVRPKDRVIIAIPTGKAFLPVFFGSIMAGAVPCPFISPQEAATKPAFWLRRARDTIAMLGARAIVVDETQAAGLEDALPASCQRLTPATLLACSGTPPVIRRSAADIAFVQLTSGTTALPSAVQLSHGAVAANVRNIAQRSGTTPTSIGVNWLPLYHDMGLVGSVLTSVYAQIDLVLMRPFQFLHRPESWLQAIDRFRATHSPAPTFAYRYVLQRLDTRPLRHLDLSSWQTAYVGAEPIRVEILNAFERRMQALGFGDQTFLPCYGMAEASLAVTCRPLRERYKVLPISRRLLARQNRAAPPIELADALPVVCCGTPMPDTVVQIVDHNGTELPEGAVGEVHVSGPSLFSGYVADGAEPSQQPAFHTGDVGFINAGELYIVGRKKEIMILGGENHHPAEVEWIAGQVAGVRPGRAAAFGLFDAELGTERLCLLVEADSRNRVDPDALSSELRRQVRDATGLIVTDVELAPAGTIPLTTSGKIQRSRARDVFLDRRANGARP